MKVFFAILSLTLVACGTADNANVTSKSTTPPPVQQDVLMSGDGNDQQERPMSENDIVLLEAVVHVSDKDCPLYVDVVEGDLFFKAYPVNLPDELKVEGLKIKFAYALSRAPQPEGCKVDKVISVINPAKV